VLGLCLPLFGCVAPSSQVILLPDADGGVGKVAIIEGAGQERVMDRPNQLVGVAIDRPVEEREATPADIAVFTDALAAMPARPVNFTLYFDSGSDQLLPESQRELERAFALIAERRVIEVVVIAHTDTADSMEANDRLSINRAITVRDQFAAEMQRRGIHVRFFRAEGRGERDPIVPTPDGTAESRNRRVELSVR
jgi:outer membrane protein OmpA-like peptidoglycan-associated protein